jgi:hypothetical protein
MSRPDPPPDIGELIDPMDITRNELQAIQNSLEKLESMDELEARTEATLTHQQILQRFKQLFGRDMTPKERQAFFLLDDPSDTASKEQDRLNRARIPSKPSE